MVSLVVKEVLVFIFKWLSALGSDSLIRWTDINYLFSLLCKEVVEGLLNLSISIL